MADNNTAPEDIHNKDSADTEAELEDIHMAAVVEQADIPAEDMGLLAADTVDMD